MQQPKALDDEEKQVCSRVAAVRRFDGRSQEEFARSIDLTRAQLANIEAQRTSLRFPTGWSLCRELNVSQLYIAVGQFPVAPFVPVSLQQTPFSKDATFREVCLSKHLHGELRRVLDLRRAVREIEGPQSVPAGLLDLYENYWGAFVRVLLARHPPEKWLSIMGQAQRILSELSEREGSNEKARVTSISESDKHVAAESQMAHLLVRLKKATGGHGKKSELARYLGVPLSSVSQWLSGEREPGGETTLRLLHWIEGQEGKP